MEEVVNDLWAHLGFVLQWAKYGINVKPKDTLLSRLTRAGVDFKELI